MRKESDEHGDDAREAVTLRIDSADLEEARRRATAERRPLSAFLRNLVHDALATKKVIR